VLEVRGELPPPAAAAHPHPATAGPRRPGPAARRAAGSRANDAPQACGAVQRPVVRRRARPVGRQPGPIGEVAGTQVCPGGRSPIRGQDGQEDIALRRIDQALGEPSPAATGSAEPGSGEPPAPDPSGGEVGGGQPRSAAQGRTRPHTTRSAPDCIAAVQGLFFMVKRGAPGRDRTCDHRIRSSHRVAICTFCAVSGHSRGCSTFPPCWGSLHFAPRLMSRPSRRGHGLVGPPLRAAVTVGSHVAAGLIGVKVEEESPPARRDCS
jgi:hypothetical protein